jgi:hypothetical protein
MGHSSTPANIPLALKPQDNSNQAMSASLINQATSILPDHSESKKGLKKLRRILLKNQKRLERGDPLILLEKEEQSWQYLSNRIEENVIKLDHLIKTNGERQSEYLYKINGESDDIEEMNQELIDDLNWEITTKDGDRIYLKMFVLIYILLVAALISTDISRLIEIILSLRTSAIPAHLPLHTALVPLY